MGFHKLQTKLECDLTTYGLEVYPFKVGDYNALVQVQYHLPYHDHTLAFLILSQPRFFELGFLPFLKYKTEQGVSEFKEPLNECISFYVKQTLEALDDPTPTDLMFDSDMQPGTRQPTLLVQTAGHVSGAAYYYQRKDVAPDPWPENKKINGVSLHPRYIGWFAFRAVAICKNVLVPELASTPPEDVLQTFKLKKELLERFNDHPMDWSSRDILPPSQRYSELQKRFCCTDPAERGPLICEICEQWKQ